jgi:hypothetical protein
MQGYLNPKGYGELDASGWNTWLTFSDAPPTSTVTPTQHLVTSATDELSELIRPPSRVAGTNDLVFGLFETNSF